MQDQQANNSTPIIIFYGSQFDIVPRPISNLTIIIPDEKIAFSLCGDDMRILDYETEYRWHQEKQKNRYEKDKFRVIHMPKHCIQDFAKLIEAQNLQEQIRLSTVEFLRAVDESYKEIINT